MKIHHILRKSVQTSNNKTFERYPKVLQISDRKVIVVLILRPYVRTAKVLKNLSVYTAGLFIGSLLNFDASDPTLKFFIEFLRTACIASSLAGFSEHILSSHFSKKVEQKIKRYITFQDDVIELKDCDTYNVYNIYYSRLKFRKCYNVEVQEEYGNVVLTRDLANCTSFLTFDTSILCRLDVVYTKHKLAIFALPRLDVSKVHIEGEPNIIFEKKEADLLNVVNIAPTRDKARQVRKVKLHVNMLGESIEHVTSASSVQIILPRFLTLCVTSASRIDHGFIEHVRSDIQGLVSSLLTDSSYKSLKVYLSSSRDVCLDIYFILKDGSEHICTVRFTV